MSAPGQFKYPTYFEEFMGDIFSMGFGPFRCLFPPHFRVAMPATMRWHAPGSGACLPCTRSFDLALCPAVAHARFAGVCTSGKPEDLRMTDRLAEDVLQVRAARRGGGGGRVWGVVWLRSDEKEMRSTQSGLPSPLSP